MLAARYPTGGPDAGTLEVCDIPKPEPGPNGVRVRVAVSGVNPTDWKARRSAALAPVEAAFVVPNQEGAGVIDAVGDGGTEDVSALWARVQKCTWESTSG